MLQAFELKVNGLLVCQCQASEAASTEDFVSYLKAQGVEYDKARDILEVVPIVPVTEQAPILDHLTKKYHSGGSVDMVVERHINNMILTYGIERVSAVLANYKD